jgi:hypothetical protein
MSLSPRTNNPRIEPLSPDLGDFTPEMVELDAMISEVAQQSGELQALRERVFLASVGQLPAETYRFADHAAKRGVLSQKLWFRSISGQVAMAASLALAFGVALWIVLRPTHPDSSMARNDIESEFALAGAFRPLHEGPNAFEGQFDYLLDTNELTSPDDINDEVAVLIQELEM